MSTGTASAITPTPTKWADRCRILPGSNEYHPVTRQPSGLLVIAPEVQRALTRSEPVVGLESSLIAHNLPAAVGPDVARECEQRVRDAGAVPATIAVIDGQIHVGIDDERIERLAVEPEVRKVGPRDLGAVTVSGMCGATTVAGTMAVCRVAGVHFMATAGIGGAHRGWATSGDISADVLELGTSPVCVVCSGARSFLDTAATLELLETYGVPVIGYAHRPLPALLRPLQRSRAGRPGRRRRDAGGSHRRPLGALALIGDLGGQRDRSGGGAVRRRARAADRRGDGRRRLGRCATAST